VKGDPFLAAFVGNLNPIPLDLLEIDNNCSERAMKHLSSGERNSLFCIVRTILLLVRAIARLAERIAGSDKVRGSVRADGVGKLRRSGIEWRAMESGQEFTGIFTFKDVMGVEGHLYS
jgi:hypothetical protein